MAATNVISSLRLGLQGGDSSSSVTQHPQRSRPGASHVFTGPATGSPGGRVGRRDVQGRELRKTRKPEVDPARYRHSTLHNICTDMLEDGFHQSFAELFTLVEQQKLQHERAGPEAVLLEPLIEGDVEKLEQLKHQLTVAEEARRAGDLNSVYMALRSLAQYFEQTKDTWLSDHFYNRCLETGVLIKGDHRRKEGEAHCHVGLALENRGDLDKASSHLEVFKELAQRHKWHTDNGDSLYEIACEHLRRVYTSLAKRDDGNKTGIHYFHKALDVAKEGGDSYQEGVACYRLGNAYQQSGEYDQAIKYHKGYLERCRYHSDDEGMGKAYEALSKAFESKGEITDAVKFLEMYVGVAEKAGVQTSVAKACRAIGIMCNTLGDYNRAVEYLGRTYTIFSEMPDAGEELKMARVQLGIAKGHQLMGTFSHSVCTEHLDHLLSWKHVQSMSDGKDNSGDEEIGSDGSGEQQHKEDSDSPTEVDAPPEEIEPTEVPQENDS